MDIAFDPFNSRRVVIGMSCTTYCYSFHYPSIVLTMPYYSTACDDAKIRVWTVPDGGLTHTLTEPDFCLIGKSKVNISCFVLYVHTLLGHHEKPNVLAFHPQADSILASGGYDGKLLLWNLSEQHIVKEMKHLPQPVY